MKSPKEAHRREKLQQKESFKDKCSIFLFFLTKAPNVFMICFDVQNFDEVIFRAQEALLSWECEKAVLATPGNSCGIHSSPRIPKKVDSHT